MSLKRNKILIALILFGSFTWSLTMVKSGILYSYGMGFWGPNGHDGIWHIALSKSLAQGSWEMPVFAGESIKNYHIGFDLLIAILHKTTFIPITNLYFQILPPIFAVLIGVFVNLFVYSWTKSSKSAFWAIFYVYFGGSLGFMVTLFRNGSLEGESLFWSQQAISTLVNPPFAMSLLVLFAGLFCLQKALESNNRRLFILCTFLFGFLVQIKVYAGVLVLGGLGIAGIFQILRREGTSLFKVAVGSFIVSIIVFIPISGVVKSVLVFQPFWFLESMMQLSDRLGWQKFGEAMANYKTGKILDKYFISYLVAFGVFVIGNFGTRIISFLWFHRKGIKLINYSYIDLIIITIIVLGIFIPLLFVQSGTPWNTIQFLYYSLTFSGILTGITVGKLLGKNKNTLIRNLFIFTIVVFTLPTTLGTLINVYLPNRPPSKIPHEEVEALNFLSSISPGIVLTYPFDKFKAKEAETSPPRPLYLYESTAYVSAMSGMKVFLEDEVNLNITGYNYPERRQMVQSWYKENNSENARRFLVDNEIKYIYWIKGKDDSLSQRALLGDAQLGFREIFNNDLVRIYEFGQF